MKQLLSIEYAKLRKLNSLKTILFIYMGLIPLWMIVYGLLMQLNPVIGRLFSGLSEFCSFPNVWLNTFWCASCFNVLMGVSIVIITCNEIHFKTMRQNVIDGLSKKDVILSKFLVVFMLATIVTIYTTLVAVVFGISYSGISGIYENCHYIFVYYLQTLGYFSVAFLLASIIKRPALSIVLFICIFPIEWIGSLFVPDALSGFMPLRSMSRLTPFPFERIMVAIAEKESGKEIWIEPLWMYIATAFTYITAIFMTTYLLLKRRDL